MHEYRCKNCGGQVTIENTSRFVECGFCGSTFELDPNRAQFANLYSAADDAWNCKDFDQALQYYLQITEMDNFQSEAHWGAALCRYGIAYEIDPVSGEKKPTCNRTNRESIFDDKNYIAAMKHASPENKQKYLSRATEIERISVAFLKIVETEPGYDVFLSYKRTDERGLKTIEAEYAMKLYLFLKSKGIRVFFAEETLKQTAGAMYEPYIFAALQSSKVMVLLGSSKENVESTWVKNEWQRFLKLMEADPGKALLPAYLGDPYAVFPQRLLPLQAFNAGSPAFVEEVLETVNKKITNLPKIEKVSEPVGQQATVESLLERAFLLVSDGAFEKAAQQLEKVLDIDPRCGSGYLCGLLIEFRVTAEEQLPHLSQRIDLSPNYKKIMMFAPDPLKNRVTQYANTIMERLGQTALKLQELEQKKTSVIKTLAQAESVLDGIDQKRKLLQGEIEQEETGLSTLKNRISQLTLQRDNIKLKRFSSLWICLLALLFDAGFTFWAIENVANITTSFFFYGFFLPAAVFLTFLCSFAEDGKFSFSSAFGGISISIVIFAITFIVVCIVNGGGIIESILNFFYDITLGLLFGDQQVLTEENLQQSLFFGGHAIYVISLAIGIIQYIDTVKDRKMKRSLTKQIQADTLEYEKKAQQNTALLQLKQQLQQQEGHYNGTLVTYKQQLHQEYREYTACASQAGRKPESLLPEKYL